MPPRAKHKTQACLNCGYVFAETNNYCPQCGQENQQKIRPIGSLMGDFANDLLQIDTRLFRSFPAFLFFPGKLTNRYLQGKRVHYITPLRLYLTTSFLYFFLFSIFISKNFNPKTDGKTSADIIQLSLDDDQALSGQQIERKIKSIDKKLKNPKLKESDRQILEKQRQMFQQLQPYDQTNDTTKAKLKKGRGIPSIIENTMTIARATKFNEDQIMDSLKIEKSFFNRLAVRQSIRLANATPKQIVQDLIQKIPFLLFFLLPVFAFILKIAYLRRKRLYIEHFIFTLHIHSLAFFALTIGLLVYMFKILPPADEELPLALALAYWMIYTLLAFKNVYKQNWFKTIIKYGFVFFVYIIVATILLLPAVLIGLAFF